MLLFLEGLAIRGNASFLEDWFDKAFAEGTFSIFLCSMEAYLIDGGNVLKLKGPFTDLFQKVWISVEMFHSWKIGLIKLLPKVPSPSSFAQWRPISLMGGNVQDFCKSDGQ